MLEEVAARPSSGSDARVRVQTALVCLDEDVARVVERYGEEVQRAWGQVSRGEEEEGGGYEKAGQIPTLE